MFGPRSVAADRAVPGHRRRGSAGGGAQPPRRMAARSVVGSCAPGAPARIRGRLGRWFVLSSPSARCC